MEKQIPTNRPLILAATLMAFTCALHVSVGGADITKPLRASSTPADVQATLMVVWHMISVLLAGSAVALVTLSRHPNRALFAATLCVQLSFVALFLTLSLADLGSPVALPQWTLFAAIAALMLWSRR